MRYWLTTHWPLTTEPDEADELHGVWLQDRRSALAEGMEAGDMVFIFEVGKGPAVVKAYPNGATEEFPRKKGRNGIVVLARLKSRPADIGAKGWQHLADGRSLWWRFHGPTEPLSTAGFVSLADVRRILGYEPLNSLRLYGGIKELTEAEFDAMRAIFDGSSQTADEALRLEAHKAPLGRYGPESEAHRELKELVAADPAGVLGKDGLTHWDTEHPFATKDRVDVVLRDKDGRFVAVEIEVDCDENEQAGPLQCMKYRALLAYHYGRPEAEVRSFLVARRIHKVVKEKCKRYGITCFEVPGK